MKKRILGAAAAAVAALAAAASPAMANNDPHRTYLAATPVDLPVGYCSFPVRLTFPVDKEYATVATTADGSTVLTVTGHAVVTATNEVSGNSLTLNASGPATFTTSADGGTEQLDGDGVGVVFAPNGPRFGLPSGLVQTSGPLHATIDTASQDLTSLNSPHVLTDICSALS